MIIIRVPVAPAGRQAARLRPPLGSHNIAVGQGSGVCPAGGEEAAAARRCFPPSVRWL